MPKRSSKASRFANRFTDRRIIRRPEPDSFADLGSESYRSAPWEGTEWTRSRASHTTMSPTIATPEVAATQDDATVGVMSDAVNDDTKAARWITDRMPDRSRNAITQS